MVPEAERHMWTTVKQMDVWLVRVGYESIELWSFQREQCGRTLMTHVQITWFKNSPMGPTAHATWQIRTASGELQYPWGLFYILAEIIHGWPKLESKWVYWQPWLYNAGIILTWLNTSPYMYVQSIRVSCLSKHMIPSNGDQVIMRLLSCGLWYCQV